MKPFNLVTLFLICAIFTVQAKFRDKNVSKFRKGLEGEVKKSKRCVDCDVIVRGKWRHRRSADPQEDNQENDSFIVEMKFLQKWNPLMNDHESSAYRLFESNVLDAVTEQFNGDRRFLSLQVQELKETPKGILATVKLHFKKSERNPVSHLKFIVSRGHLSSVTVDKKYFKVLESRGVPELQDRPSHAHQNKSQSLVPTQETQDQTPGPTPPTQDQTQSPTPTPSTQDQTQSPGPIEDQIQLPNPSVPHTQPIQDQENNQDTSQYPSQTAAASSNQVQVSTPGQSQIQAPSINELLSGTEPSIQPQDQSESPTMTQDQQVNAMQTQAQTSNQVQASTPGQIQNEAPSINELLGGTEPPTQHQGQMESPVMSQDQPEAKHVTQTQSQTSNQVQASSSEQSQNEAPSINALLGGTEPPTQPQDQSGGSTVTQDRPEAENVTEVQTKASSSSGDQTQNSLLDSYEQTQPSNQSQIQASPQGNRSTKQENQTSSVKLESRKLVQSSSEGKSEISKTSHKVKDRQNTKVFFKMNQNWYPFLSNHEGASYKLLTGNIEKGLESTIANKDNIGHLNVQTLRQAEAGLTEVELSVKFKENKEDGVKELKKVVKSGDIAGIPINSDFFKIEEK